jgi:transglutaminase/protease-like cytokinesis protein 3
MLKRRFGRCFACVSTPERTTKELDKTKNDNDDTQNRLLVEQRQSLPDTFAPQQPILSLDLIKRVVVEALSEQNTAATTRTTDTVAALEHQRKSMIVTNHEVEIRADQKQTRIDAVFQEERDAVVANKNLRDAVKEWSNVSTMEELVAKIKACGKNDLENAWLLFCWIGQNIRYDLHCKNNAAESVFQQRTGVCRGFVSLYHECCSLLSIECLEISGYAKQAFLKPGKNLKDSPHAWNAIVLGQYTHLLDPTWGAGGGDNTNELEDFYFLTSPEELIYTHYCYGHQLLDPEISKEDFLSLPVMKSTYYRLNLNLLSPKQGFNETNQNLFKIAIKIPEQVDVFAQLKVGDAEYPRNLHTLCQHDATLADIFNCYIAPPADGLYEIAIYAKTNNETTYRDAIYMRLHVSNVVGSMTFPLTYTPFREHQCFLIEPLGRLVQQNERVFIHMKIPDANVIQIQNGDDYIVPTKDEYKNGVLMKEIRVQGDISVCGRWDDKADSISTICVFFFFFISLNLMADRP